MTSPMLINDRYTVAVYEHLAHNLHAALRLRSCERICEIRPERRTKRTIIWQRLIENSIRRDVHCSPRTDMIRLGAHGRVI